MAGGVNIGPNAPTRKVGNEFPQILDMFNTTVGALDRFQSGQPLLNMAETLGMGFAGGLGNLTGPLMSTFGNIGGEFGNISNRVRGLGGDVMGLLGGLPNIGSLESPLMSGLSRVGQTIRSGGALTPEQNRDVTTSTGALFASRGNEGGNQAIGQQLLDRQQFQQNRFDTALQEGQSLSNSIEGLGAENAQVRSGIMGESASLLGESANLLGQGAGLQSGLASNIQNLETGSLNQLLGPESGAVSAFSSLFDPNLSYASNLFSGNQAAQLQTQLANQNKGAGLTGGGISGAGNILSTIIGLIPLSDQRLKTGIKDLGIKTKEGIPIKTFQYKGDPQKRRFIGSIAQDVQKVAPHAVVTGPDGFMRINRAVAHTPFHMIGSEMGEGGGQHGQHGQHGGFHHQQPHFAGGKRFAGGRHHSIFSPNAPITAFSPGKGNKRMEGGIYGKWSHGRPMNLFGTPGVGTRNNPVSLAIGPGSHYKPGQLVNLTIHGQPVWGQVVDFGPGVRNIDVAVGGKFTHWARNLPAGSIAFGGHGPADNTMVAGPNYRGYPMGRSGYPHALLNRHDGGGEPGNRFASVGPGMPWGYGGPWDGGPGGGPITGTPDFGGPGGGVPPDYGGPSGGGPPDNSGGGGPGQTILPPDYQPWQDPIMEDPLSPVDDSDLASYDMR